MPPWLLQSEIDDLCAPLIQHAAQIRFIRSLGITVRTKPNGAPLVMRTHFDEAMLPSGKTRKAAKAEPNRIGLQLAFVSSKG